MASARIRHESFVTNPDEGMGVRRRSYDPERLGASFPLKTRRHTCNPGCDDDPATRVDSCAGGVVVLLFAVARMAPGIVQAPCMGRVRGPPSG